jgi:hypothetical protein
MWKSEGRSTAGARSFTRRASRESDAVYTRGVLAIGRVPAAVILAEPLSIGFAIAAPLLA